jgi:hypothetical protein
MADKSGSQEKENEQSANQTPLDESQRRTGMADDTNAKPTAVPEAGTSEQPVEGAPNQGTEKR